MRRRLFQSELELPGFSVGALTALVDLLTVLLIFLLQTWAVLPAVGIAHSGMVLARSTSEDPLSARMTIEVSGDSIWVDGIRVADTSYYANLDDELVSEVYRLALRESGPPVALRVDARVPYLVVRKLLYTLRQAGADDVTLEAESKSSL